jgi:hypothetical protein
MATNMINVGMKSKINGMVDSKSYNINQGEAPQKIL